MKHSKYFIITQAHLFNKVYNIIQKTNEVRNAIYTEGHWKDGKLSISVVYQLL